jgi:hypothetical protein
MVPLIQSKRSVKPTPTKVPESQPLTEQEMMAVEERIKGMKLLLEEKHSRAKYRMEVFFQAKRSTWKPTIGIISFWLSGNKLHGGGDEKIYLCPGPVIGKDGMSIACQNVLESYGRGRLQAPDGTLMEGIHCYKCGRVWPVDKVIGERVFNVSMQGWANILVRYYALFNHDADIMLKYSPDDIRTAAFKEQAFQKGGELLHSSRCKRAKGIYRLANIIKDTSTGSGLYDRFYAFLTA